MGRLGARGVIWFCCTMVLLGVQGAVCVCGWGPEWVLGHCPGVMLVCIVLCVCRDVVWLFLGSGMSSAHVETTVVYFAPIVT